MKLAKKISEQSFVIDGIECSVFQVLQNSYRIHLNNGDIQIYEKREDMPTPVIQFDLEFYKQQVNEAHNNLFRELYTSKNYLSIGEISLWVDDSEFGVEATNLRNWWNETCKIVIEYLDAVTEETAISVDHFILSLPQLQ